MSEYGDLVRGFDHTGLGWSPEYRKLREALSDFCNAVELTVEDGAAVVRDALLTSAYAEFCDKCDDEFYEFTWPFRVERDGDWLACLYRCEKGHVWRSNWNVNAPHLH